MIKEIYTYGIERAMYGQVLYAPDKVTAIRQIAQAMFTPHGYTRDEMERVALGMLAREETGSTGIGSGIAVPHTRYQNMKEPCVGWFVAYPPIDFESLDGNPVRFLISLVAPPDEPIRYLRIAEPLSQIVKQLFDLSIDALSYDQLLIIQKAIQDYRYDDLSFEIPSHRLNLDPMGKEIVSAAAAQSPRLSKLDLHGQKERQLWSELLRADFDLTCQIDREIRESAGAALCSLEVRVCDLKVWVRATIATEDQARLRGIIESVVPDGALMGILLSSGFAANRYGR
jgi:PTS system nitrogen regulatory IIA component